MQKPPFPARLHPALLLALGFALLVLIAGASVWLVAQADADSERAVQTLAIKEKLANLQGLVWRAESNQRSFLLGGDLRYREAFRADARAVDAAVTQLEAALAGQGNQSALLRQLDTAIADELSRLERTAAERERSGLAAPAPALASALAESRAEEIRTLISRLVQQEQRMLEGDLGASRGTARLLLMASLFGVLLIIVLAVTSIIMLRRSTGRLVAAQRALQETNETLEETVARRTAELRQANEEIQNFAYVVSHDLRSPLVNIMGFTGELETIRKDLFSRQPTQPGLDGTATASGDNLDRDFDEALSFIKSSISRMDRLIKAILKLTREGRREFRREPIDMTELVRSIADGLGYQAQVDGASIAVEPLPPILGDRLALEQIFGNLLENALKYLRVGTPGHIGVSGRATSAELVYEVSDNGRGIEAKDLNRIFEIFRRSGPQDRPGEGIGLTHVRTLVRRLDGTITVRSEPGEGSTFIVTFPSRPAHPPEIKP
jgi:signal transduction histidine kinase